jgi:Chaperone of endosialidase
MYSPLSISVKGLIGTSINQPVSRRILLFIACILLAFALSPAARAVSPPPDGGYSNDNTAEGTDALFSLTSGTGNTANGLEALYHNQDGSFNTAVGSQSLFTNTSSSYNTAIGYRALLNNTSGSFNTAVGLDALVNNTSGTFNTADGVETLFFNTTGNENTAVGDDALSKNEFGNFNTATGSGALSNNSTGNSNTAAGCNALANTFGNYNTATGEGSLFSNGNGHNNTADGQNALKNSTGSFNIGVGSNAEINLTTGDNNIDIFNRGVAKEANTIRIGKQGTQKQTYVAGIYGATVAGGVSVIVDKTGQLGTATSSQQFKTDIKPIDNASAVLALKPVTFRYKQDIDFHGIPQFGLVAEQVEQVNPDLVAHDEAGNPYTVWYEAVNAMLLNEFLKAHRKLEEQQTTIERQQKQLEALIATVQRVSDQVELNRIAPQVATNSH